MTCSKYLRKSIYHEVLQLVPRKHKGLKLPRLSHLPDMLESGVAMKREKDPMVKDIVNSDYFQMRCNTAQAAG
jgi:hypothetical protein